MIVAIEGIDGSGKGTQACALTKHLTDRGYTATQLSFPRYSDTFFGREAGCYLNGDYGDLNSVSPKFAALLFAGDRFETREMLIEKSSGSNILVCDRYTGSNLAHQAAKRPSKEWPELFRWIAALEYEIYLIPKPDIVIFLDITPSISAKLIVNKPQRSYTSRTHDIHEESIAYQNSVYKAYTQLATTAGWRTVKCVVNNNLREIKDLSTEISSIVHSFINRSV